MRKLVDTLVLVLLLVGPAVILTCVRQPDTDTDNVKMSKVDLPDNNLELAMTYDARGSYAAIIRP